MLEEEVNDIDTFEDGATDRQTINPPPRQPFMTELEAARLLRLSERTLQRWRVEPPSGQPLPFIRAGRRVFYDREALFAWARGRTVSSTAEADAV